MTLERAARIGAWTWSAGVFNLSVEAAELMKGVSDGDNPFGPLIGEELRRKLEANQAFCMEWSDVREGRRLSFRVAATPKGVSQMVGVLIELKKVLEGDSEVEALRTEILALSRLAVLGPFVRSMVHEINNPLMVIDGSLRRAAKAGQASDYASVGLSLERIQQASRSIGYSMSSLKEVLMERSIEDRVLQRCEEWVKGALSFCARRMEREQIEFKVIYREPLSLWAHPNEGVQVLVHLINNAIDAIGAGGEKQIELEFFRTDEKIHVDVRDWGIGVSEELADRVFEPFVSTKKGAEVGLGLAHVKRILRLHGGDVRLISNSKPTAFRASWPNVLGNQAVPLYEGTT